MKGTARYFDLLFIAALAILAHSAAAETSDDSDSAYDGAEFRRWSAVVSSLEETVHLYTDILGFELGDVTTDPKTSYVYEVFDIGRHTTTRHATFHAGEKKRVLSVVEVPGAHVGRAQGTPRMSVALLNANGRFDEIVRRLQKEGYDTLPPHKLGETGIEIGFMDRDGHLYALYEYPYTGNRYAVAEEKTKTNSE